MPRSRESFNILPLIPSFVNRFFEKNEICKLLTFYVASKAVFLSKKVIKLTKKQFRGEHGGRSFKNFNNIRIFDSRNAFDG
jgi:hypothetical protein